MERVEFAPNTQLRIIGQDAFYGTAIESMTIPEGVETIGDTAFHDSTKLKNIVLPSTIKEIRTSAFGLTTIEEMTLPASIEKLNFNSRGSQGNGLFFRTFEDETKANLRFTKVYDNSGKATSENTRAIVNPVKVTFKYVDEADQPIASMPSVSAVGINKKKITQYPSGLKEMIVARDNDWE